MKKPYVGAPPARRRLPAVLACSALALCIPAAAAVAARLIPAAPVSPVAGPSVVPAATAGTAAYDRAERLETELITVTPTGFDPGEITRPAGPFILEVDDRAGLEEIELHLDALRGKREREARVRRTAPEWSDRLDLRPGAYVLREAAHPGWECRITVTPR